MIALRITDMKVFMNALLSSEAFDSFSLEEATITTFNTFFIDGHTVSAFFDNNGNLGTQSEESEDNISLPEFSLWKDIRPICFDLIKGKKKPVNFKFVLHAGEKYKEKLLGNSDTVQPNLVKSLILNVKYDSTGLTCVTGTAFTTFVMDKTPDKIWDDAVKKSFHSLGIDFEEAVLFNQ